MANEPPQISAYRSRDGKRLELYCPYCRERHSHEIPPLAIGEVIHRAANCRLSLNIENEPGYMIVEARRA